MEAFSRPADPEFASLVTMLTGRFPLFFQVKVMLRLLVSVNIVNSKDYKTPFLFPVALPSTLKFVLCQEALAKKQNRTL